MITKQRIRRVLAALTLLAAPVLPTPAAAQTTPDQLQYWLRGATTPEQFDRAIEAAQRGRDIYDLQIRQLDQALLYTEGYFLRSGSGALVSASREEFTALAAQVMLELMIDPSNERVTHLRANASGSSQVDLAVRIALDRTVFRINQGLARGRETPNGEKIGRFASEVFIELIEEFDRQNREAMQTDLEQLRAELERLDGIIERAKGSGLARGGGQTAAPSTAPLADGTASDVGALPTLGPGTYVGEADPRLLINRKPTRSETPVYLSINPDGTGSLSLNFFVKSEYQEKGSSRVACLLGGGRVNDLAIGADGAFETSVPSAFGYRSVHASAEDPCLTIEGRRTHGDFGDSFPVKAAGRVDLSSGTARVTLAWPSGPVVVNLKPQ